jgi:hypothetical protein
MSMNQFCNKSSHRQYKQRGGITFQESLIYKTVNGLSMHCTSKVAGPSIEYLLKHKNLQDILKHKK